MEENSAIDNACVFLYTSDGCEQFPVQRATDLTVEDVCQQIAQHIGLSPHTTLLCGLTDCNCTFWLSPHEEFAHVAYEEVSHQGLYFRVRLLLPSNKLQYVEKKDRNFLEYFYFQCRHDFLNETITKVYGCEKLKREHCLGFGVVERLIFARDSGITVNQIPTSSFKFSVPFSDRKEVISKWKPWKSRRFNLNFMKCLTEEDQNCRDTRKEKLWVRFINGIFKSYPGYMTETYKTRTQNGNNVDNESISVEANSEIHGVGHLRNITAIRLLENQDVENENFQLMRWIVMIFRDTQPKRIFFEDKNKAESFISLLIGYYRLSVNYYVSLSEERKPPSFQKLNRHCYGPIRRVFCEKKVKEKGEDAYLIRQSSTFDQLEVFLLLKGSEHVQTLTIDCLPGNEYRLEGSENREHNLLNLLQNDARTSKLCNPIKLRNEENYGLLLCRESGAGEERDHLREQPTQPVAELLSPHQLTVNSRRLGLGLYTDVVEGSMRGAANRDNVAVKRLRQDNNMPKCLQFFLRMAEDLRHMKSEFIVKMKGISLSPVPAIVLEHFNMGCLVEFLTNSHSKITPHLLLQATLSVMNALKFLSTCCLKDDAGLVHGNVRCRNILVYHTPTSMDFKLADPGMVHLYNELPLEHPCNLERQPWLAPELRADLRAMTHDSDLYALGVTTWEIWSFSRRPPDDTCTGVMSLSNLPALASCSTVPETVEKITRQIIGLVRSCLNPDPSSRRPLPQLFPEIYPLLISASDTAYSSEEVALVLDGSRESGLQTIHSPPSLDNLVHVQGKWYWDTSASVRSECENRETDTVQQLKRPLPNVPSSNTSVDVMLPRDSVILHHRVGMGHFGDVYKGEWMMPNNKWGPCAVKKLKKASQPAADNSLDAEMNIMIKLDHNNIVKMHGFCLSKDSDPFLLVMEYVDKGSLDKVLKSSDTHPLPAATLFTICCDVAKGMKYLVSMNIVHRDLAARNVLITSGYRAKITDFGLARILGEKEYYRPENPYKSLPLSYYAPESLSTWRFTEKGDVWSYGILLWEIYTKGDMPELLGLKEGDQDKCTSFYNSLKDGNRLHVPLNCPNVAGHLMVDMCWEFHPENRPVFTEIVQFLEDHRNWSEAEQIV